ncbi:mevalonate diphosphate decarboxylase [Brevipalpus obovatus]|uniref:mevalonate diphosphate decarboxylase n=1 Tax=Brevipalpus obovatus TaxID=246614 RepID=UPI003D9E9DF9
MDISKRVVTVRAPVNIAVVKYWGKKDENSIVPLNNSISATLNIDDLCATTTIKASSESTEDQFWLNGQQQSIKENLRLSRCLETVRSIAKTKYDGPLLINSNNNFPTAAGLASSAAGYSCLVSALGAFFDIDDKKVLTKLARLGSGSACRSIYGGFVEWKAGTDHDSSFAEQIVDENHWSSLRVLILVLNDAAKEVSSTGGMKRSVETSKLLEYRAKAIVPERCQQMRTAILDQNFHRFAELTMKDSNQFHATCLDTYPPIFYLNQASKAVIELVHAFNDYHGKNKVAYTFDAGPNAFLFMEKDQMTTMLTLVNHFFPSEEPKLSQWKENFPHIDTGLIEALSKKLNIMPGCLKGHFLTQVGSGPEVKII